MRISAIAALIAFTFFALCGCFASTQLPSGREDLLSGQYRVLPGNNKPLDEEERQIVLTVKRAGAGWVLAGLKQDIRLEEKNGAAYVKSGLAQLGHSSHYIIFACMPGTVLEDGSVVEQKRVVMFVMDRGGWELERIGG